MGIPLSHLELQGDRKYILNASEIRYSLVPKFLLYEPHHIYGKIVVAKYPEGDGQMPPSGSQFNLFAEQEVLQKGEYIQTYKEENVPGISTWVRLKPLHKGDHWEYPFVIGGIPYGVPISVSASTGGVFCYEYGWFAAPSYYVASDWITLSTKHPYAENVTLEFQGR